MLPMKAKNQLPPPPERRIVTSGTSPLSPDKEVGPFLLYLLGDDVETVALKTSYPKDTIQITCQQYNWQAKRDVLLTSETGNTLIKDVEKSLLDNILMATYVAAMKQVGEVMTGKLDAAKCSLIPTSMQGLQRLLEMVEKANGLVATNQKAPEAGTTVVHADNVQINQGVAPPAKNEPFEKKRTTILQMLADKAKASMERK